jgi:hypothetical protein
VARDAGLDTPAQLGRAHLPLLAHMRRLALGFIEGGGGGGSAGSSDAADAGAAADGAAGDAGAAQQGEVAAADPIPRGWAVGFHSVPSMRRLHLHVISTDMDSPALKTKVGRGHGVALGDRPVG